MSTLAPAHLRSIVFDLDGTLYVCERFATEIQNAARTYIAGLKGIGREEAGLVIAATRRRLTEAHGTVQTLSAVCTELGGDIRELHHNFERTLRPEAFLVRDDRVIGLMERLAAQFSLYIYTNNNRILTHRILAHLGLAHTVRGTFTIDDSWRGKPDEEMLLTVLQETGFPPHKVLFVGDRYDVDLRVPEQLGCPVYLSRSPEQLLRLEELLAATPSAGT
jgi:putative hydrolase of the HAD superfamily